MVTKVQLLQLVKGYESWRICIFALPTNRIVSDVDEFEKVQNVFSQEIQKS